MVAALALVIRSLIPPLLPWILFWVWQRHRLAGKQVQQVSVWGLNLVVGRPVKCGDGGATWKHIQVSKVQDPERSLVARQRNL